MKVKTLTKGPNNQLYYTPAVPKRNLLYKKTNSLRHTYQGPNTWKIFQPGSGPVILHKHLQARHSAAVQKQVVRFTGFYEENLGVYIF